MVSISCFGRVEFAVLCSVLVFVAIEPRRPSADGPQFHKVIHVSAGDVVEIERTPTSSLTFHLLGVHTDYLDDPKSQSRARARASLDFLFRLLAGQSVAYEFDRVDTRQDSQGCNQAYIRRASDGLLINLEVIEKGFGLAEAGTKHKLSETFFAAEKRAHKANIGLWNPAFDLSKFLAQETPRLVPASGPAPRPAATPFYFAFSGSVQWVGPPVQAKSACVYCTSPAWRLEQVRLLGTQGSSFFQYVEIIGRILNQTGDDCQMASFTVSAFDRLGVLLEASPMFILNIQDNEEKSFSVSFFHVWPWQIGSVEIALDGAY